MTPTTHILIAVPVCLLAIILWIYFDSWKYKRKCYLILTALLLYPALSYAQYTDKTHCNISFSSHVNQPGKLECTQNGITYRFTPDKNTWKISIRNNTDKDAVINWGKASFIINGKASGISFYPLTTDVSSTEFIKGKSEITRSVTATNLIKVNKVYEIYNKRHLKKNGQMSVNLTLPIKMDDQPLFFNIFNFVVTAD